MNKEIKKFQTGGRKTRSIIRLVKIPYIKFNLIFAGFAGCDATNQKKIKGSRRAYKGRQ